MTTTTNTFNPSIDRWATTRLEATAETLAAWTARRPDNPLNIETSYDGWLKVRLSADAEDGQPGRRMAQISIDDPEGQLTLTLFEGWLVAGEIILRGGTAATTVAAATAAIRAHLLMN